MMQSHDPRRTRPAHGGFPDVRPLDTSTLGPIRMDHNVDAARRAHALQIVDAERQNEIERPDWGDRDRWIVNAMLAFSDAERDAR
jgi:hypothetical protein